jgi:hypothetical protein
LAGGAVTLTCADALTVESAADTAETVTIDGEGTLVGAV